MLQLIGEEHYTLGIILISICSTHKKIVLITVNRTSATNFCEENLNLWHINTNAINQRIKKEKENQLPGMATMSSPCYRTHASAS